MIINLFKLSMVFAVAVIVATYAHAQPRSEKPIAIEATATTSPKKPSGDKTPPTPGLNPALKLLSANEKQLLEEINFARANPGEYLKMLEAFRKNFRGKEIHYPEGGVLVTNEGAEALDDAIKFLRDVKPLPKLEIRSGMVQAAKVHTNDMAASGKIGHRGSDGSQAGDRIDRFGKWEDSYGENIVYDSRTPRYDVIGMVIDDGTANRGHRENLFAEDFRVIGIATGIRGKGSSFVVVTFAGGLKEK